MIMASIQLCLVLIYTCVLLIKACDMSSLRNKRHDAEGVAREVCSTYGFGPTSDGEAQDAMIAPERR